VEVVDDRAAQGVLRRRRGAERAGGRHARRDRRDDGGVALVEHMQESADVQAVEGGEGACIGHAHAVNSCGSREAPQPLRMQLCEQERLLGASLSVHAPR